MKIVDGFGREVNYMRVSLTPRCNLRCAYCFPEEGAIYPNDGDLLSLRQITRLAGVFSRVGIRKVRLTGGEPLVRKGITTLISDLKATEGVREVTLSTNGVLLGGMIDRLKGSGLDKINVSLDSLKPGRFKELTGRDVFSTVMEAVERIALEKIWPLKLNVVAIKGVNDDEILDFALLAARYPMEVRFIELMPAAQNGFWRGKTLVPAGEIKRVIEERFTLGRVADSQGAAGPAEVHAIAGGAGRIGFISPLSKHFCDRCNRIRLTAEGTLRSCLFSDKEVDLKPGFENGEGDEWFLERLARSLSEKPDGHALGSEPQAAGTRPMTSIGG